MLVKEVEAQRREARRGTIPGCSIWLFGNKSGKQIWSGPCDWECDASRMGLAQTNILIKIFEQFRENLWKKLRKKQWEEPRCEKSRCDNNNSFWLHGTHRQSAGSTTSQQEKLCKSFKLRKSLNVYDVWPSDLSLETRLSYLNAQLQSEWKIYQLQLQWNSLVFVDGTGHICKWNRQWVWAPHVISSDQGFQQHSNGNIMEIYGITI